MVLVVANSSVLKVAVSPARVWRREKGTVE
jgi:hypothetical protein